MKIYLAVYSEFTKGILEVFGAFRTKEEADEEALKHRPEAWARNRSWYSVEVELRPKKKLKTK